MCMVVCKKSFKQLKAVNLKARDLCTDVQLSVRTHVCTNMRIDMCIGPSLDRMVDGATLGNHMRRSVQ